jgi:hypothetical protein
VLLQRFWRTLNYEKVYLKTYDNVAKAPPSIGRHLQLEFTNTIDRQYNEERYSKNPDYQYNSSNSSSVCYFDSFWGMTLFVFLKQTIKQIAKSVLLVPSVPVSPHRSQSYSPSLRNSQRIPCL